MEAVMRMLRRRLRLWRRVGGPVTAAYKSALSNESNLRGCMVSERGQARWSSCLTRRAR